MKIRGRVLGGDRPTKPDEDLSPDELAAKLEALQNSQSELAHTLELLAGQIESLRASTSRPTEPSATPAELQAPSKPEQAPDSAPPPPPPRTAGKRAASPPPPSPGVLEKGASPTPAKPPPPPSSKPTLSPLDQLLGEDFGKPRGPSTEIQPPPGPAVAPDSAPATAPDSAPSESSGGPGPQAAFRVGALLDTKETAPAAKEEKPATPAPAGKVQVKTVTPPAAPFAFNTSLEKLRAGESSTNGQAGTQSPPPATGAVAVDSGPSSAGDEPATANLPAPDFFRSEGQSFASAAAMVNDILAVTPDAAAEPGKAQAEESVDQADDEPAAPDVPITPDFFTAQSKKRFRLRR